LVPIDIQNRLDAIRARVYVSCWYAGDESAALWQRSPRDTDFVAIQTTLADIRRTIRRSLPAAAVKYIDYKRHTIPAGSILNPFFCKRQVFMHENEFRVVLYSPEFETPPAGQYVAVSPRTLLRKVMLAPYTKPWVREAVEEVLRTYGIRCPVVPSTVDAEPTW
jgi:hypothetical protein